LHRKDPLPNGIALGFSVTDEDMAYLQFVAGPDDGERIHVSRGSIYEDMFESMSNALAVANACSEQYVLNTYLDVFK
jgi:hypothetical protein